MSATGRWQPAGGARLHGWLLLVPALAAMGAFLVWPVLDAAWTSLHVETPFAPRRFIGLENYRELLADRRAGSSLGFTVLFVAVSVSLETVAGLLMALVVHRAFRGRGLVRALMLVPWAVPTVVAAVMWKYMLNDQYGVVNLLLFGGDLDAYRAWLAGPLTARGAVVLCDVWKATGFCALLLLAGLQAVPKDVEEAALLDGAGPVRRFLRVTLPLLRPALLVTLLLRTMDAFRIFDAVFVLTRGGPGNATSVLQLYGYQTLFPEQRSGYGSAVSVGVFVIAALVGILTIRLVGTRLLKR